MPRLMDIGLMLYNRSPTKVRRLMDTSQPTKEARVARVILRTAQRTPSVSRTMMSIQARPYGASWTKTLQDLIDRDFIIEEATIAARRKNRRAVISYRLGPAADGIDFEDLEAVQVQQLVFGAAVA